MELLIPGLILVALMVWASTKIKKRAAEAFEPERIETGQFSLSKPEGFLHVIGSEQHLFEAYSKEFGENDDSGSRRATIAVDLIPDAGVDGVCDAVWLAADKFEYRSGRGTHACTIETDETANLSALKVVYKIVGGERGVYRFRFAVLAELYDQYAARIDETLDSFEITTAQLL
jgi:hypothetical protein